jgi:integrase
MSAQLRLVRPRHKNRSVLARPPNAELRTREYLTPAEVEKLIKEAQQGRYGHRDAILILIAFRHGLRAAEICDLEWSQVEFGRSASLHVRRVKNGKPSVHPLRGDEIRALRELRRQFPDSGYVFATERGGPFTADAVNRLIKRIGERAGFDFPVHIHMLRHTRPPFPYSDVSLLPYLQHSFWFLPNVAACHAMANLLAEKLCWIERWPSQSCSARDCPVY